MRLAFDIPLTTRFRGITRRQGLLIRGAAGWGEFSPFLEYVRPEIDAWWAAAVEAAEIGWPEPVRESVPVNCTIPAVAPERAYHLTVSSGCATAKVKIAEPGESFGQDVARVAAVREALGPSGKLRVDVNGAWSVDDALSRLRRLARFDLEYVEQPCASVDELAELRLALARAGVDVLIAADESIRRSGDPERVVELAAADVAVLKVQPLGGVRACLELAEQLGLPVVVSSAVETSVGLRAGLALAAALPELPFACGLGTATLLALDVTASPLLPVAGQIAVRDISVDVGDPSFDRVPWLADEAVLAWWQARANSVS